MPKLLIADDHPLFRAALRGASPEVSTREAETLDGVLEALQNEDDIDLVLLDLPMPGNHGLAGPARIRAQPCPHRHDPAASAFPRRAPPLERDHSLRRNGGLIHCTCRPRRCASRLTRAT